MSRNAEISFDWAGDYRRFRLAWGELELLQEECDFGPYVIADRLRPRVRAVKIADAPLYGLTEGDLLVSLDGEALPPPMMPPLCSVKEIAAVIRLGLIGGGMKPGEAMRLVRSEVMANPPEDNRAVAFAIIQTALYGAPEERLGEPPAPDLDEQQQSSTTFPTED